MNMKEHCELVILMLLVGSLLGMIIMYLILALNKQIIDFNAVMGW